MTALHDGKTKSYASTMEPVGPTGSGLQPKVKGYEIVEKLGEGGMGTVWRAIQKGTKREVALKLMSDAMFYSDRARARFEREVELAARLEHPNIARIYDSGLEGGVLYYAMELIESTQLAEYVRMNRYSTQNTMRMMLKICKAVGYAHRRGVIHRDLKPSNILVDRKGEPKILDFGLAKSLL
ncbi:MAG: serine/threonine-protein kinase, partial [Verrucomicrobiota bacterium]